jgi:hypothetical protein
MAHPLRFQLSRKKGYRKPEGGVVVTRNSRWGNPFVVCEHMPAGRAVLMFRECLERVIRGQAAPAECDLVALAAMIRMANELRSLRGKQLGCFCPLDKPCHADVLCELANI